MGWITLRRTRLASPASHGALEELAKSIAEQCKPLAKQRLRASFNELTPAEAAGYIRARMGDLVRATVAWRMDQRGLPAPAEALYELSLSALTETLLESKERRNRQAKRSAA